MLIWSGLLLAAGVWANPSATSRADRTNSRDTFFMESSEEVAPCGGMNPLGFDCASDFSVEILACSGPRLENFGASKGNNNTTLPGKNPDCLFQTAHITVQI
jgi:hypothetical protein